MYPALKSRNTIKRRRRDQRGYMLITLMLALALLSIALLTVLPEMGQQIKRDRELELQHRGTSYMRAIQHFYKKFGRYPMRFEELENTNNQRFIRKRYTDPMNVDHATGKEKEFKPLHQQDISLGNGMVLGQTPGSNLVGGAGLTGQPGQGGLSSAQAQAGLAALQGAIGGGQIGGIQQNSNAKAADDEETDANGKPIQGGSQPSSSTSSSSPFGSSGQTLGGGPILGVASTSKAKSIRVFYDKNHYNDWLFIYVPQADRGGLLTGPINPGMPGGNAGGGFGAQTITQPIGGQPPGQQTPTPPPQTPVQPQPQQ